MVTDYKSFSLSDFGDRQRVLQYVETFGLAEAFEATVEIEFDFDETPNRAHAVDPGNTNPYPPKWDDLARVHWLTRVREAVSVVEFGAGYSTSVIAHALEMNQRELGEWAANNRRIDEPFTVLSIDQSDFWLTETIERTAHSLRGLIRPHPATVVMGTFQGRACSFFEDLPNFVADFVFLDGPDQYAPQNSVRGFSTGARSLMPMAGDLLLVEHFFEPGATIVVDGRTANARFLKQNFQRSWLYKHFQTEDFHIFELAEAPLGRVNANRVSRLASLLGNPATDS